MNQVLPDILYRVLWWMMLRELSANLPYWVLTGNLSICILQLSPAILAYCISGTVWKVLVISYDCLLTG